MSRSKPDAAADTLPSLRPPAPAAASSTSPLRAAPAALAFGQTQRIVWPERDESAPPAAASSSDCLLEDELLEYQAGHCSEAQLARMDAHLDDCAHCRDLVHHLLGCEKPSGGEPVSSAKGWPTTFAPGSLVSGRYLIRRFVGRGGMGEVYEAFDRLMDMRVALKTVICTASDRPQAIRKLMDEVRNALRVGHPNVCRINELHEHHEPAHGGFVVPFFTMEFIEGERLGERLAAGPLPLDEARVIARQLLGGLEAAHDRGVLHLDFKADNVMLRSGGAQPDAVIMDFGLSRVLDCDSRQRTSERLQLAGTLPYMSLEQLECRPTLGPPADVYSFGVVLYEMLTGRLPFEAGSLGAMLMRQLKQRPPPPSELVPGLAPALDRFVLACLSNDPAARPADAGAVLAGLDAVGSWRRGSERRGARPRQAIVIASAGLLLAGGGVWGAVESLAPGRDGRVRAAPNAPAEPQQAPPAELRPAPAVARAALGPASAAGADEDAPASASLAPAPALAAAAEAVVAAAEAVAAEDGAAEDGAAEDGAAEAVAAEPRPRDRTPRRRAPRPPAAAEPASARAAEEPPPLRDPAPLRDWTPRALPKTLLLPPSAPSPVDPPPSQPPSLASPAGLGAPGGSAASPPPPGAPPDALDAPHSAAVETLAPPRAALADAGS